MADPLTAFSTAGAVLQVVDFGAKALDLAVQYAREGGTSQTTFLQSYIQTLITATARLQEELEVTSGITAPGPARALAAANRQCLTLSNELVDLLQSLKIGKRHWLKVAQSAVREYLAQPRIQILCSRLESAKSNLAICFMVYTISQTHRIQETKQERQSMYSINTTQEMQSLKRIWESQPALMDQALKLCNEVNVVPSMADIEDIDIQLFVNRHKAQVDALSKRLDHTIQDRSTQVRELTHSLEALQADIDREMQTRALIIGSLDFPEMNDRLMNIKRAHSKTLQWMFKGDVDACQTWDNFAGWLYDGKDNPVYWIRGKAGSGKSTLIREVLEVLSSDHTVKSWQSSSPMLIANCFFWHAGVSLQRSMKGLLQGLVNQILTQQPCLVYQSVNKDRWDHVWWTKTNNLLWTTQELKEILCKCANKMEGDVALLLLIDGLDEFDGNDEERLDMINFLTSLTKTGWVKVCVSSRPWNIYRAAFEDCPGLRLEDLTRADIENYINSTLQDDKLFMRKLSHYPGLVKSLTTRIVDCAEGVFLWVRLVVRDLVRAVRDICQPNHLFRTLDSIPRDLDEYFVRMMQQMDPAYRRDAALIIKAKLCNIPYRSLVSNAIRDGPPLRLFDLLYLDDQSDNLYITLDLPGHTPYMIASNEQPDVGEQFDTLERRVASRSMGLLEVSRHKQNSGGLIQSEITFLHRTVKDFLCTPRAQAELDAFLGKPFDLLAFRCTSLMARLSMLETCPRLCMLGSEDDLISWLECFLHWAESPELDGQKMIEVYQRAVSHIALFANTKILGSTSTFAYKIHAGHIDKDENLPLYFVTRYSWKNFAKLMVTNNRHDGRAILDHLFDMALTVHISENFTFNLEMIRYLVSLGADPNMKVPRRPLSSKVRCIYASTASPKISVWIQFLADLYYFHHSTDCPDLSEIIKTLLRAQASHHIPLDQFIACCGTRPWYPGTPFTSLISDEQFQPVHCIRQCQDDNPGVTVHVLEILRRLKSGKHRGPAFNDQQLIEIGTLCDQVDLDRI